MSITDELREWARDNTVQGEVITTHPVKHPVHGTLESLVAISDRIDATYEEDVNTACKLANSLSADELAEHGWIRLPVDVDGVPIHVGDRVEYLTGGRDIVRFVTLNGDGWTVNERGWEPFTMHHYTPPTVEGVLREFADRVCNSGHQWGLDAADTIAEYAAKLRLAGDGE